MYVVVLFQWYRWSVISSHMLFFAKTVGNEHRYSFGLQMTGFYWEPSFAHYWLFAPQNEQELPQFPLSCLSETIPHPPFLSLLFPVHQAKQTSLWLPQTWFHTAMATGRPCFPSQQELWAPSCFCYWGHQSTLCRQELILNKTNECEHVHICERGCVCFEDI